VLGGHLEFGESWEDTARREVREETGLEIKNIRFGGVTNDVFPDEGKHYITIWMISDWESGVEEVREPEKCTELRWCNFDTLPKPLLLTWDQLLGSEFLEVIQRAGHASRTTQEGQIVS
jgi:8-oxo-dGTP diphosphatase